jgi:glyoxylase-like metal-dependent hydrolase (beta-lactamase superfamily II)
MSVERGDVTLRAFHAGGEIVPMSVLDASAEEPHKLVEIPWFFFLVEHPQGKVLYDTGGHPALVEDPVGRLGSAAEAFEMKMHSGDDVVSQLATVGLRPAEITHVVTSHLHYDHSGGSVFFPHAKMLIQKAELEFGRHPSAGQADIYIAADYPDDLNWVEIEGGLDLFGDGIVVVVPTPGHTPGHQSLFVQLKSEAFVLVGDAAYMPRSLHDSRLPGIVWDADLMTQSWETIRSLVRDRGATVLYSHDVDWRSAMRVAPEHTYA